MEDVHNNAHPFLLYSFCKDHRWERGLELMQNHQIMGKEDAERFISDFSRFYFDDTDIPDKEFVVAGLPKNLNRTNPDVEKHITEKINKGIYDAESLAWKAGKAKWKDGHFDYAKPLPGKLINGSGGTIKLNKDSKKFTVEDFDNYISENPVDMTEFDLGNEAGRKELFLAVKDKYDLFNYGTVYIINQIYFLSKGAVPIYDRFAHMAVKSLFMNKSPVEVYVPYAPLKDEHRKIVDKEYYFAMNTLEEYMWLLEAVFSSEIHKNGNAMYISRELDQALWVYGHATRQWTHVEGK